MNLSDEVKKVVSRVLSIPEHDLSADAGLGATKNWDSLNHTTLVLELEEAFDISFDFDELDKIVTIREIVKSLSAKGVTSLP